MSLELRRESPDDAAAVRDVVTRAFDTDPVVADLWDALRERGSIGIVAVDDDGSVCGHVGLTWCWLDAPDRLVDVLVLSPLSVAPEAQRHGHARALLAAARATAEELGSPLLFLEGDPAFYTRFDYVAGRDLGFDAPSERIPGRAFQVLVLPAYDPATMTGRLVYADPFWAFDCVGLRGDLLAQVREQLGD